jgi:ankyrin repeat protein
MRITIIFLICFYLIPQASANPLVDASDAGDMAKVMQFISHGKDINSTNQAGYTALHRAAYRGNFKLAKFLLDNGANINSKTIDGYTPFDMAVSENHIEIVKLFIANGLTSKMIQQSKVSPLDVAERKNYIELVKEILKIKGMYIDKRGQNGTPLFWAAKKGHLEIVELLLSKGVSINKSSFGITPLEIAARGGHSDIVKLLQKKSATSLFLNAAEGGILWLIKDLVAENKVEINDINNYKSTALHKAAYSNQIEVVKFLVLHGAFLNPQDKGGATPLYWAISNGNSEVANFLLKKGAKILNPSKMIFASASGGFTSLTKKLLSMGVDVNVVDSKTGKTPIFEAVQGDHIDTVRLLLASGANINIKYLGSYPYQWAKSEEVKKLLLQ